MDCTLELTQWKDDLERSIKDLNTKTEKLDKTMERIGLLEELAETVARERMLSKLDQSTKFESEETDRLLRSLGLQK